MKNLLKLVGLFGFMVLLPLAHAKDATGTWKGAFEAQGTSTPLVMHLKSSAGVVTGTIEGLSAPTEIHDGKVDGDTVTFWINSDYQGTTYKIVFKGKIGDGQIDFSFGTEDGSWGTEMIAKNADPTPAAAPAPANVSGNWKGAADMQGTSVPLVFHFTSKEGVVTGTIDGLPSSPIEIHDGKVDGDTIAFWINSNYGGTIYKVVWNGKIAADGINFTLGTDDNSWTSNLTATKSL
jgi:hypothetical protein